jgi:nicotinamidase-related amidase
MKILVVIDMQNDFLEGTLRNEEGIKIIPNVINKIKEYKNNNDLVIATRDTHDISYLQTEEGKNLPVIHCVKKSLGWEINKNVQDALGDVLVFDKPTFGSLELASWLKSNYENIQDDLEIELVGVCTDICVVSNAILIKAHLPEAKIICDASCCAGVTIESHKAALSTMKSCQIKVIGE